MYQTSATSDNLLPTYFTLVLNKTIILRGEWVELHQTWLGHRLITGTSEALLYFRHIAVF